MKIAARALLISAIILIAIFTKCGEEKIRLSKVTIGSVSSLTENTATVSGRIIDAGSNATAYGICWSTSTQPDINDNKRDKGGTVIKGIFDIDISGLTANTMYYARAYIMEEASVIYSLDEVSFTTSSYQLPTVTTSSITVFTYNSATMGGDVTDDGGSAITEKGICWSDVTSTPEITDDHLAKGTGTGSFSENILDLKPSTTYSVRAYAINSVGTGYGNIEIFTTEAAPFISIISPAQDSLWEMGFTKQIEWIDNLSENVKIELLQGGSSIKEIEPTVSSSGTYSWLIEEEYSDATDYAIRISSVLNASIFAISKQFQMYGKISDNEGNKYRIVKIGDQWWMRENLRSTEFSDGTMILNETNEGNWLLLGNTDKAYCYYDNDNSNASLLGALYTWAAAMNGYTTEGTQGVCPTGWHLPSDTEWKTLEMFMGMSGVNANGFDYRGIDEGNKLKESGLMHWKTPNGGTNTSNFTALGVGYRSSIDGNFYYLKEYTQFWTSTFEGSDNAWYRELYYSEGRIGRISYLRNYGRSVRCVKD